MKTRMGMFLLSALIVVPSAYARDWEDALWGGLTGAAIGAIVGNNSRSISSEVAIPAFAVGGALLATAASSSYRHRGDYYYYDDPWDTHWDPWYRGYGYSRWNYPYRYRYSAPAPRTVIVRKASPPRAPKPPRHDAPVRDTRNRQPGVDLATVSLTLPSGTVVPIRILHVNGKYVGPQGEQYDAIPTQEELAARYMPVSD